jgi:sulfur carrier protein ThiS
MASRDYLIRQIEEMGLFLAILLRRILKMKEENQQAAVESVVKEALLQELKLDIDSVVVLENTDFLAVAKQYFTSEDQLEKLADILKVLGQDIGASLSLTKINYLQKSLFLFTHLQETSSVFSYERRTKIMELQELLLQKGVID